MTLDAVGAAGARTPALARQEAAKVFYESQPDVQLGFRRVLRDAANVDSAGFMRNGRAKDQLQANLPLEVAKLQTLDERSRGAYQEVAQELAEDPQARLAWQLLLLEGKLPGDSAADCGNVLEQFQALRTLPLHPKIDRQGLLRELARELAVPSAITQGNHGTCTVTTLQILMAMQQPAEYVRVVGGLASVEGKSVLADGQTVAERQEGTEKGDGSWRTATGRLWQTALMELANGPDTYDNKWDRHASTGKSGLQVWQMESVLGALQADRTMGYGVAGTNDAERIMRHLETVLASGTPVPATLKWDQADRFGIRQGSHEILVHRVEADAVHYYNPWGLEEKMSRAHFMARCTTLSFSGPHTELPEANGK